MHDTCTLSLAEQGQVFRIFDRNARLCLLPDTFVIYNLKMSFRRFCLILYLIAGLLWVVSVRGQVSKGHQILINRGLQLQGLVTPDNWFHPDTYSNANYTAVGFSWNSAGNL